MTRRHAEIGVVYLAGLAQGLALVTFPAAANIFTHPDFHNLTNSQYGSLFLPMIACAVLASSLGGAAARRWGLRPVFLAGLAFNITATAILASSHAFVGRPGAAYALLLVAIAALGAGFGATLTTLNTYAAGFFPAKAATALTALHAVLGTGTALAPLLLALFHGAGAWWGLPVTIAASVLILTLASLALPLEVAGAASGSRPPGLVAALRGVPARFWAYPGIAILYGICETVFGNWATIYLHEEKGLPVEWGGFALATFWAMVTAGRVLVAAVSVWLPVEWIYRALPVLILGTFLGIPTVGGQAANVAAFAVAGLACSAFLPLTIGFATREFKAIAEVVSGVMIAAYMLGYGLGAYGVGPMREFAGFTLSAIYAGSSAFAVGMALLAFYLTWLRQARPALSR